MMKKYFLAATALLMLSLSVASQNSDGNGKQRGKASQQGNCKAKWTAKDRAGMMEKQLDLSDTQVSQLQAFFEKKDAERTQKREAMRTEMEKEKQAFEAEVEKIIGKEKADKWKSLQKKQRKGKNGKRGK